jgi:hypothetical protein
MQASDNHGEKLNKAILKVEDLKPGDKFYDVNRTDVLIFTYLCVHPHNEKYHILIDLFEEPKRIWEGHLQNILDKKLNTYEKARLHLADTLEEKAKSLRNRATYNISKSGENQDNEGQLRQTPY